MEPKEIEESKKIKDLLDKKISECRVKLTGNTPEANEVFNNLVTRVIKLEQHTLQHLKTEPISWLVFRGLLAVIVALELPENWVAQVFGSIALEIRSEYGGNSRFLSELNQTAIEHFETIFKAEFNITTYSKIEDDILPEIMQQVRDKIDALDIREIKDFDTDSYRFKFKALTNLQCELEKEFNKRAVAVQRKKEISVSNADGETEKKRAEQYSPNTRTRIVEAAVRLSEERDRWRVLDLCSELDISRSTFYKQLHFFKWEDTRMLRDEAEEIIREKDKK